MAKPDNRTHLAAIRPCGCLVSIMTIKDDGYEASPLDIADWYRNVGKKTERKRNPLKLEVVTLHGRYTNPWSCNVCCPPKLFE